MTFLLDKWWAKYWNPSSPIIALLVRPVLLQSSWAFTDKRRTVFCLTLPLVLAPLGDIRPSLPWLGTSELLTHPRLWLTPLQWKQCVGKWIAESAASSFLKYKLKLFCVNDERNSALHEKHPKKNQDVISAERLARMIFHIHSTWAELSLCIPIACLYCLQTMTHVIPFHLSAVKPISLCSLKENIFIGQFLINIFYTITLPFSCQSTVKFSRIKWPLGGISQEVRTLITSSSK